MNKRWLLSLELLELKRVDDLNERISDIGGGIVVESTDGDIGLGDSVESVELVLVDELASLVFLIFKM